MKTELIPITVDYIYAPKYASRRLHTQRVVLRCWILLC